MRPSWDALYAAGAEVVLSGHDHDYERFAPQTPGGTADAGAGDKGVRRGHGGASHKPFGTIQPNSQVRNADTYGVLKLTLHPSSYDWGFVPEAGKTFTDSGSDQCHGAPGTRTLWRRRWILLRPPRGRREWQLFPTLRPHSPRRSPRLP